MTINEFLEIYVAERDIAPESVRQIKMSLKSFTHFYGREQELDELSHQKLNAWANAKRQDWAPKTIKNKLSDILALWSYAYAIEITENQPNRLRVRHPRIPKHSPDAWTVDQLNGMLEACDHFRLYFRNGVKKGDFLKSVILVGFYSALRAADLMKLKRSQLVPSGESVPISKRRGDAINVWIPQDVIDHINKTYPSEVDHVFCWPQRREYFYNLWKRLLTVAQLPTGKREGLQKLRRTAVSYGEAIERGYGASLAGHKPGSRLTYDHYVDVRILDRTRENRLPKLNL